MFLWNEQNTWSGNAIETNVDVPHATGCVMFFQTSLRLFHHTVVWTATGQRTPQALMLSCWVTPNAVALCLRQRHDTKSSDVFVCFLAFAFSRLCETSSYVLYYLQASRNEVERRQRGGFSVSVFWLAIQNNIGFLRTSHAWIADLATIPRRVCVILCYSMGHN